jgi:hypothetical protein
MRTFWPPTFDYVSIRMWAAAVSGAVNLGLGLVLYLHHADVAFAFLYLPSFFTYILVYSVVNHGIEVATFSQIGLVAAGAVSFVFYYVLAWWLIKAFQPATNWWPAKRT